MAEEEVSEKMAEASGLWNCRQSNFVEVFIDAGSCVNPFYIESSVSGKR